MKKTENVPPSYSRQLRLPLFPSEATELGEHCSVIEREGSVWYFMYDMPIFSHAAEDIASFRMFTSSLCDQGHCKLVDIERTFSVSAISVKRSLKQYREQGVKSFFVQKEKPKNKPRVLDEATTDKVQALLDDGLTPACIDKQTGIKADTIRHAIRAGRLSKGKKKRLRKMKRPAKAKVNVV